MTHDGLGTHAPPLRQDASARMVGVRRAGVPAVAGGLWAQGPSREGRGRATVLDRVGPQAEACNRHRCIEDDCDASQEYTS